MTRWRRIDLRENCNSSPANIYHDITIKVQSSKQRLVFLEHSLILVLRMPFPPSSCLRKNVLNNGREPSNSISEYYSSFVQARLLSYCCQRWFNFLIPLISSRFLALRSTSGLETALSSVSKFFQIFFSHFTEDLFSLNRRTILLLLTRNVRFLLIWTVQLFIIQDWCRRIYRKFKYHQKHLKYAKPYKRFKV